MKEEMFNTNGFVGDAREDGWPSGESSMAGVEGAAPTPASYKSQAEKAGDIGRRSVVALLMASLLLTLAMVFAPARSSASIGIFVSFGPPALPVYEQPPCPAPGYIWTPGYWAWDPDYGYYWVPGTWVPAPFVGALWTPGYWGWYNGGYMWYPGYWGTSVGFYGGINYGYGYTGYGYYGGYWNRGRFFYNRDVNRITSRNITYVYNQRVVVRENGPRISYNGGRGGIEARPTAAQMTAERGRHFGAINQQIQQERFARTDRSQWARENGGRPGIAATARPGEFRGNGVVRATRAGAPYNEPSRDARGGREVGRSAPAPVERAPSRNAPSYSAPNQRMERGAPAQPKNERPVYRNNQSGSVQRNERPAHPQQQVRQSLGRATQERNARPQNQGKHEGGNGHKQEGPPR
jgi:WXXGXW repeat (2 copies)